MLAQVWLIMNIQTKRDSERRWWAMLILATLMNLPTHLRPFTSFWFCTAVRIFAYVCHVCLREIRSHYFFSSTVAFFFSYQFAYLPQCISPAASRRPFAINFYFHFKNYIRIVGIVQSDTNAVFVCAAPEPYGVPLTSTQDRIQCME